MYRSTIWSSRFAAASVAGVVLGGVCLGQTSTVSTVDDDDRRRSPVQRPAVQPGPHRVAGSQPPRPEGFPHEYREIDGWRNNRVHEAWGSAGIDLVRYTTFDDRLDCALSGDDSFNPRVISNRCMVQSGLIPNQRRVSDYIWVFGQFLDHDIDETPVTAGKTVELCQISVPIGDPVFDEFHTGAAFIPFARSAHTPGTDVREQRNNITAFIDASNVYGSDNVRAMELRKRDGTGRLETSEGDLLPFNVADLDNSNPFEAEPSSLFLAGDIRANEQIGLTAMHTLFVREHNYWADLVRAESPEMSGDDIYESARAIVVAEMQAITFREFLPVLLGPNAIPRYQGYRADVDPSIANVFATAAYRVGHTMLSPQLRRVDAYGGEIDAGHIALRDAFFNPQEVIDHGIDPILRGFASQTAQNVDVYVIDEVRNFLFVSDEPEFGGFDLASLNIQRGRDHGLPGYNQVRVDIGLPPAGSFDDITPDATVIARLQSTYASVDDVDAWVGMLAEPHAPGALVGQTVATVLTDQFVRLRDGDRMWYERYLPPSMAQMVEEQTLATIIRRNTSIGLELQDDVFVVPTTCPADLDGSGDVGFADLAALLVAWGPCVACPEDLDGSGQVGFADLTALLDAWGVCPVS